MNNVEYVPKKEKDNVWSQKVRKRDKHQCRIFLPGCLGKATDACHIISRVFIEFRWDVENGIAGCRKCHSWLEQHPTIFKKIIPRIIGESLWKKLNSRFKEIYKRDYE